MQWQFDRNTLVTDALPMEYVFRKCSWWKRFGCGIRTKDGFCQFLPTLKTPNFKRVFSYAHIIYFLEMHQLKAGWDIIVYDNNKAVVVKDQVLFLEVRDFKDLKELYQYLYRFEFDDQKPFHLIINQEDHLTNIQKAFYSSYFLRAFNLNKEWPFIDLSICITLSAALLGGLYFQTGQGVYPEKKFFETLVALEMQHQTGIKKISSRNKTLNIIADKDQPLTLSQESLKNVKVAYR